MKERFHQPAGRIAHTVVVVAAVVTGVAAWAQAGRVADGGKWLLVLGSLTAIVGIAALVRRRERPAGVALLVAAGTLPTGYSFIPNLLLAVLAIPLVLRPSPSADLSSEILDQKR